MVKDPGGTEAVVPVFLALQKYHPDKVCLIANGKAVELLQGGEIDFEVYQTAEDFVRGNPDPPKILLTSMCSQGGTGRDLVPILREKGATTIAVQDFPGARMNIAWKNPQYRPDCICVNDTFAAEIVSRVWPDFSKEKIEITGSPAFDKYFKSDTESASKQTRERLGILEDWPVILFAGQAEVRDTSNILYEVVSALNDLSEDIYFIPRQHPRMSFASPEQVPIWDRALKAFHGGTLIDSSGLDFLSVISATSLLIAQFSTTLIAGTLLRKDCVSVMYPSTVSEFHRITGDIFDEFFLISLGCVKEAKNQRELKALVQKSLKTGLELREEQEKHFKVDGKNALRVVQKVLEYL